MLKDWMFSQLNIGMLYNVFVCVFVALLAFILAARLFYFQGKTKGKDKYWQIYLAWAWFFSFAMWFSTAFRTFFTLRLDNIVDKWLFYSTLIFFTAQLIFFLFYLLSVLFHKYAVSSFLLFISILLPVTFLLLAFLDGLTFQGFSFWGSNWSLPSSSEFVLLFILVLPSLLLMLIIFLRELVYLLIDRIDKFDKKVLYTMIPCAIYFLAVLPDIVGDLEGWINILLRTLLILAAFLTFIIYSGKEETYDIAFIKDEKYYRKLLITRPLLLKTAGLVVFSTLIPLAITLSLMYYSVVYFTDQYKLENARLINDYFEGQILILGVLIGILSFSLSMMLARTVLFRLQTVYKGTKEITRENFEYVIEDIRGHDEISLLGILFNKMTKFLKEYQIKVEQTSLSLEDEVVERTKELEQKTAEADSLAEQQKTLFKQLKARTDVILEQMADGILVIDGNGVIIKYNTMFVQWFGIDFEVKGKFYQDIMELNNYPEFVPALQKGKEENLEMLDVSLVPRLSTFPELDCRLSTFETENKEKGFIAVFREVITPWGRVYDAQTKEPIRLAVVRLFDEKTSQIIDTEVTDADGRFGFFVKEGSYYLTVIKEGYHFPGKDPAGYHGEVITVKNKEEGAIKFNISMDPVIEEEVTVDVIKETAVPAKQDESLEQEELLTVEQLEAKEKK